jgi:hypothetical protein
MPLKMFKNDFFYPILSRVSQSLQEIGPKKISGRKKPICYVFTINYDCWDKNYT